MTYRPNATNILDKPIIIDGVSKVASTSTPYTMLATDRNIAVNKTTPAVTLINLPANPSLGTIYTIFDMAGNCETYTITITAINGTILAAGFNTTTSSMTFPANYSSFCFKALINNSGAVTYGLE